VDVVMRTSFWRTTPRCNQRAADGGHWRRVTNEPERGSSKEPRKALLFTHSVVVAIYRRPKTPRILAGAVVWEGGKAGAHGRPAFSAFHRSGSVLNSTRFPDARFSYATPVLRPSSHARYLRARSFHPFFQRGGREIRSDVTPISETPKGPPNSLLVITVLHAQAHAVLPPWRRLHHVCRGETLCRRTK